METLSPSKQPASDTRSLLLFFFANGSKRGTSDFIDFNISRGMSSHTNEVIQRGLFFLPCDCLLLEKQSRP